MIRQARSAWRAGPDHPRVAVVAAVAETVLDLAGAGLGQDTGVHRTVGCDTRFAELGLVAD
jgi:hypothetical protein